MSKQQTNPLSEDAISALVDGALQGDAFASAMQQLAGDDQCRARWHTYHVVGDVLRSGERAACQADNGFLARFEARLALEPARPAVVAAQPAPVAVPVAIPREAANAGVFRWKMAAGFASMAAVAAIGFQLLQAQAPTNAPVLAQSQSQSQLPAPAVESLASAAPPSGFQSVSVDLPAVSGFSEAPQVMLRNAQLDELLAAHNRAVGGSALQSQARLLRNVSISEDMAR